MPLRRPALLALSGLLALAALASACGGGGEETTAPSPSPRAGTTPTAAPSVEIVTPQDGATLSAGNLPVQVRVSNFQVVDKLGMANAPNEGHVHFFLLRPDEQVPTTAGRPAVTGQGTYHATATTSYTWPNVQPGQYKVAVELVNNDHTPLSPPVVKEIRVTVR